MADGIAIAAAGMIANQTKHEAVVDNLANASTRGFKASRTFARVLDEVDAMGRTQFAGIEIAQQTDFTQGALEQTGRPLDLALDGDGFFVVETPAGERYMRNGALSLNAVGELVDTSGNQLLGESGPLTLPPGDVSVTDVGEVFVSGDLVGKIRVESFDNVASMRREGAGLFAPGEEPLQSKLTDARVCQGCLESSNVVGINEMVQTLSLMKLYEASQRIVKMQNAALGRAVNEIVR